MHESSYKNMERFVAKYLGSYGNKDLVIIDIGSQDIGGSYEISTYKPLFQNPRWKYIGCDVVEGKNVDLVLSHMYHWSNIKSGTADVVISGQTFEHIEYIWVSILEIARILKEGGLCCIIAPSAGYEHPHPVDCWRFYPDGFSALAKFAGLKVLEVYTQWDSSTYPDYSPVWKDTVLVCRKPRMRLSQKVKFFLKNRLSILLASRLELT